MFKMKDRPPHDPLYPGIGCFPSFAKYLFKDQMHLYFIHMQERHGPIATSGLFHKLEYYISDPAESKRILSSPDDFARSDMLVAHSKDFIESALFAMPTGETWKIHRRAIARGMGAQFVKGAYVATVELVGRLCEMREKLKKGENKVQDDAEMGLIPLEDEASVNVTQYLSSLTLDVIGRVGFSHDDQSLEKYFDLVVQQRQLQQEQRNSRRSRTKEKNLVAAKTSLRSNLDKFLHALLIRALAPSAFWGLLGASRQAMKAPFKFFEDMINKFLIPRKQEADAAAISGDDVVETDLLSILLQRDESGSPKFSDKEIRDSSIALLLAGHETTATTLTNIFFQLAQRPQIVAKLRTEIDSILGIMPTFEELSKFKYLDNVIKECQRINPVVFALDRVALKDVEQNVWGPDAAEFNPDRFDGLVAEGAFIPFGAGPHMCPGQKMALVEMKGVVIGLLSRYKFSLVEGQNLKRVDGITVHFVDGLQVHLSKI
ncbi:cytochrome P450 [Obelidium mucronatum]|nr:cytochrome P450 [Obelidium mucronatum]